MSLCLGLVPWPTEKLRRLEVLKESSQNGGRRSALADAGEQPDRVDQVILGWVRERPDIDPSSIGIITRIWRLGRHFDRHRKDRLTEHDTDRVTLDVLAMLRRSGAPYRLTAGQIMHAALITSGAVSQRLEKLERAGMITRHVHSEDRRRVDVELTDAGIKLVDSVVADLMDHEAQLLAVLSVKEQAELRRLLRKLLGQFESSEPTSE